jgi:tripartite ATP-independent transporter DctM subunit
MNPELVGLVGILALLGLIALRVYIGVAMAVVAFVGIALLNSWDAAWSVLGMVPFTTGSFYPLSVIPLFVLMGQLVFHSGMSQGVYKAVYGWVGHLPGGLAIATVIGCAGFSAMCGSSLATAATMGTAALPEMKRYRYDPALATGSVAAGGTLGILIPPSIGFVLYGILTEQSIGRLLMAGILPGALLTGLYALTIYLLCLRRPELGPASAKATVGERLSGLGYAWPTLVLFLAVIGGIYAGIFTPIEAAGVGAFVALGLGLAQRRLSFRAAVRAFAETLRTTAMIFLILVGAEIFTLFLGLTRLPMTMADSIASWELPPLVVLVGILCLYVVLGCVLDGLAMIVLTIPVLFPLIEAMGFDPIWFGVLMMIVLEIGLITPPVGMNVFVIRGVAKDVPLSTIFRGVVPFIGASVLAIALILLLPQVALFIPEHMLD